MGQKKSLREHLERMKYVSRYAINETPKYKSLVGGSEFDTLPEYLKEAPSGDTNPAAGAPAPDASAGLPPLPDASAAPTGGAPEAPPAATPVANTDGMAQQPDSNVNVDISTTQPAEQPPSEQPTPAPVVDTKEVLQQKAMELQLDALRRMSSQIEDLGGAVDSLNKRMEIYSDEVDQVREPSDQEKFENRKIDSSPYYYNLNDLWDGNNFKTRMDQFAKGYTKTEDGYVADFDDLPRLAPHEVKASFDDF